MDCRNNTFHGDIIVEDTLQNDYNTYTLNIDGNIINNGVMIAEGQMDELRLQAMGQTSLEEIFLELTGGPDMQRIARYLGDSGESS